MASSPRRRRRSRVRQRSLTRSMPLTGIPWRLLCLTGLIYAAAGTIMAAFPAPYWIWSLGIGGTILQALTLAGPVGLSQFRWVRANTLVALSVFGTGAVAVALGVALGFSGTDALDDIRIATTVFQVIQVSLLAIAIAAFGAITSAKAGDRLLHSFNRVRASLILSTACILGLGIGALIGYLTTLG